MCNKCEALVKCHVGEKRQVEVEKPPVNQIVDAYGKKLFVGSWIMFVDKWPDGKIDSGLYQEVYDENFVQYGGGLTITHCPYCGAKMDAEVKTTD